MGPNRTDVEVFSSIKFRTDAPKFMGRLAYFLDSH